MIYFPQLRSPVPGGAKKKFVLKEMRVMKVKSSADVSCLLDMRFSQSVAVFWEVATCSPREVRQCVEGYYCLCFQSRRVS